MFRVQWAPIWFGIACGMFIAWDFAVGVTTSSSLEAMPGTESAILLRILMRIWVIKQKNEHRIPMYQLYSRTYARES